MVRLVGPANITDIVIEDYKCKALIDSGAQISTVTISFAKELGAEIKDIGRVLNVEGTGGFAVPYHGYVELKIRIPEIKAFKEDGLFLVIDDSEGGENIPIQLGTVHIDRAIELMTESELSKISTQWTRGYVCTKMAMKSLSIERGEENKGGTDQKFSLEQVRGNIKLTKRVEIGPFETVKVKGLTKIKGHTQKINVMTSAGDKPFSQSVTTVNGYCVLEPGSKRVGVVLRNKTARKV